MTAATTVRDTRANPRVGVDVSRTVPDTWPESLPLRELALKDLPSAADRAGRIALDDVDGGVRRGDVADARPVLLTQGLRDPDIYRVRRLLKVDQLRFRGWCWLPVSCCW